MDTPNPPQGSDAITEALAAGNIIVAIKLYREQTGVGLAEAKAAVEAMEARMRGAPAEDTTHPLGPSEAINAALFAGKKIEAIKLYREQTKVGLAEAKAAVEAIESQLRLSSPGRFAKAQSKGCLGAVAVLAILGLAIWKALR